MPMPNVKAAEFIQIAADALRTVHPEECRLVAELLVSRALHCPRLELPLRYAEIIPAETLAGLREGLTRLAAGLPWQYLAGEAEFFGRAFKCDRRALIPRPETEQLVEWFLLDPTIRAASAPVIAEAGAGSGCVSITIAAELPDARCVGTDISAAALDLAGENAVRHHVNARVEFQLTDLLAEQPAGYFDAVISNPPYVTEGEWRELPKHIRDYEPATALLAGDDGMQSAVKLAPQAARCLKPGGSLFMEFAPARMVRLQQHLEAAGFTGITTADDYAGRPHFIRGRRPG